MPTLKLTKSGTLAGESFALVTEITEDGSLVKTPTIAAAKSGQLTTRTNDTSGTLTMAGGHGITTGARLDLYWTGGCRRGILVGTVATNSVPISGGAGDNLPVNLTNITAQVPQEEEFLVSGDNVVALILTANARAQITLTDSSDVEILSYEVPSANKAYDWNNVSGGSNPVASDDIAKAYFSQAGTSGTCDAKALSLNS